MGELTDKQEMFCQEYLKDLNQTQAAIRAGYSKKTARSIANQLLTKLDIEQRIAELKIKRTEEVKIDAAYVLRRHAEIDQMDIADIMDDCGSLKALREWPKVWRQYISGFDLSELYEYQDGEKVPVGLLKKIKWPDKVKNLELLGKHVDVQAYKERSETEHSGAVATVEINKEDYAKLRQEMLDQDDC